MLQFAVAFSVLFVGVAAVWPRSVPARILKALLGAIGLKVRHFEDANALGLYDRALEKQGAALKDGVAGLGEYRAVIEGLRRQVANAEATARRLESQLDAMDREGVPDTDADKIRVASQLGAWAKRRDELRARLAEKEATNQKGVAGLRLAAVKLQEGKQERTFLAADLEAADVDAKVADIVTAFSGALDGTASEMSEARERMERQIDRRRAHSAVLSEVGGVTDAIEAARIDAESTGADVLAARRAVRSPASQE